MCILITILTVVTMMAPLNSLAAIYSNPKSFNDAIVMGDRWVLISGAQRAYTSREYFGVTLTGLKSMDYSSNYTYMKARVVNENDVVITDTQTIAKSSTTIVYLSVKGNQPTLDARSWGTFYAN